MASEYTTNYQLDLYVGTDVPNLCDQYNAAMRKLDSVIYSQTGQATAAVTLAQQAQTTADTALTTANGFASSINALGSDVAANATAITAEATDRAAADTALAGDIAAEATARSSADSALTARIDALPVVRDTIAVIGDSFSNESSEWPNLVASNFGWNLINKATNEAGFTVSGNTFLQQLQALVADDNFAKVHTIIVYGGINDHYTGSSASATASAIESFVSSYLNISAPRPNLILAFGNLGYARRSAYNSYGAWYNTIYSTLINDNTPGLVWGVPMWLWGTASAFQSDNLHPNSTGEKVIATYMSKLLMGTYSGVQFSAKKSPSTGSGGSAQVNFDNGVITYSVLTNSITMPTINNANGTLIANFNEYTFCAGDSTRSNQYKNATEYVWAINQDGSSKGVENATCTFDVTTGQVKIYRWGTLVSPNTNSPNVASVAFGGL